MQFYDVVPKESIMINYGTISEQMCKCTNKINSEDYSGAITSSRTLLETVLVEIRYKIAGINPTEYHGQLDHLFESVSKLLDIDAESETTPEPIKQMVLGFFKVISGLGTVGNEISSNPLTHPHSKEYAKLAVNSVNTLILFLLSTCDSKAN